MYLTKTRNERKDKPNVSGFPFDRAMFLGLVFYFWVLFKRGVSPPAPPRFFQPSESMGKAGPRQVPARAPARLNTNLYSLAKTPAAHAGHVRRCVFVFRRVFCFTELVSGGGGGGQGEETPPHSYYILRFWFEGPPRICSGQIHGGASVVCSRSGLFETEPAHLSFIFSSTLLGLTAP